MPHAPPPQRQIDHVRSREPREIYLLSGLWKLRRPRHRPEYFDALVAYRDIFTDALQRMAPTTTGHDRIAFRWLPSTRFDAFADPRPGRRLIAISTECWSRLQGAANRLLSASDLLPHIGNARGEQADLESLAQDRRWLRSEPEPRCPIRRDAACVLAEIGLMLIFFHEYAHHALHHREGDPSVRLHERVRRLSGRHRQSDAAGLHAQEVQADCFAVLAAMPGLQAGSGAFPNQIIPGAVRPNLPSLGFVAMTLVNMCFAGRSLHPDAYATASHPHPFIRLQAALGVSAGLSTIDRAVLTSVWQPAADVFRLFQYERDEPVTAEHWERVSGPEGADAKSLAEATIEMFNRADARSALNAAAAGLLAATSSRTDD